jgi:hypothetical protein
MYRYVFKRVNEFGINVRKSFGHAKNLSGSKQQNADKDKPDKSLTKPRTLQLPPQNQNYDEFKRKYTYNCKHPNSCSNILQAITWVSDLILFRMKTSIFLYFQSTALIAGFYASQLICLYRRNHRLEPTKCFYRKYLCLKNQQFHKKFFFAQYDLKKKHNNPEKRSCSENVQQELTVAENKRTHNISAETFTFSGFDQFFENRFQKYYNDDDISFRRFKTTNVNNESSKKKNRIEPSEDDNEKIDAAFSTISNIIGEIELQMGIECVLNHCYPTAAEHFKMSANSNNNSGCYNLALLYEHGNFINCFVYTRFTIFDLY